MNGNNNWYAVYMHVLSNEWVVTTVPQDYVECEQLVNETEQKVKDHFECDLSEIELEGVYNYMPYVLI